MQKHQISFSWVLKSLQSVTAAMKWKDTCSLEEKLWQTSVQFSHSMVSDSLQPHGLQFTYNKPRQHIKKQRRYFADKDPSSQFYGFSSSCIWMWELDHKESWALKKWCFWTVMLEKTLESPLDSNQSILKEISSEYSLEGLMLKLKLQYFGHLMWRTDSLEKTLMLGKTESRRRWWQDEMVGWHHQLHGHEFE